MPYFNIVKMRYCGNIGMEQQAAGVGKIQRVYL